MQGQDVLSGGAPYSTASVEEEGANVTQDDGWILHG